MLLSLVLAVPALVGAPALPGAAAVAPAPAPPGPAAGLHCAPDPRVPCTHGPDPAPPGIDVRTSRQPVRAPVRRGEEGPQPAPVCTGDGTSGPRVQLVYARPAGAADRYDTFAESFQIWAAEVDTAISDSAAKTGGERRIRFVHDQACRPVVTRVALTGEASWGNEVRALHGDPPDRRFLVWMDANEYCGVGEMFGDDRPSPHNYNQTLGSLVARVDSGCWGIPGGSAEAHELMHTFGAVQASAPHPTGWGHCTDEIDRMCGDDGSGAPLTMPCPEAHENLFDCNSDDYFSTAPPPGSYLATHWNAADIRFLARPPSRLSGLQVAAGEGSATLSWSAPPTGDVPITGYEITTLVDGTPLSPVVVSPDATIHVVEGLTNGTEQRFTVAARNSVGTGERATFEPVVPTAGSLYHPLAPARILDTRSANGVATAGRVGSHATLELQATGRGGVPEAGVSAVVLNLTVTDALGAGYVTAWPAGGPRPLASNVNVAAGRTAANLAVVKVGDRGRVALFNGAGAAHLLADVAGWYGGDGGEDGAGYHALTPARVLDSRTGNGGVWAEVAARDVVDLQVTGRGGVPETGVTAVTLTVTVAASGGGGYVTVWPTGGPRPLASNVNFEPGQTVANAVVVKVGDGGRVSLYNGGAGDVHLVADVAGWYDEGSGGARYHALSPARVLDTRSGTGLATGLVGFRTTVDLAVRGRGGVPGAGVSSVVLNATVVDPLVGGYLSAWPAGEPRPLASNVNFWARSTVSDLVVVAPGTQGAVSLFLDGGGAHLVADVAGWFGAPA